jgi:hypothetical protein
MATTFTKSTTPDLSGSDVHRVYELVNGFGVKGWAYDGALSVTVPAITDPDIAKVDVTVTGVALGDVVMAVSPTVALPTNARFQSAYVSAADTVTFVFGSEGGNVTSAAKTFAILVADRT